MIGAPSTPSSNSAKFPIWAIVALSLLVMTVILAGIAIAAFSTNKNDRRNTVVKRGLRNSYDSLSLSGEKDSAEEPYMTSSDDTVVYAKTPSSSRDDDLSWMKTGTLEDRVKRAQSIFDGWLNDRQRSYTESEKQAICFLRTHGNLPQLEQQMRKSGKIHPNYVSGFLDDMCTNWEYVSYQNARNIPRRTKR